MVFNRILLAIISLGLVTLLLGVGSPRQPRGRLAEAPSCSGILQIFSWGQKNHGFASLNRQDPKLAKKVASLFLEKLDPNYLLFTTSEVQELNHEVLKKWNSLVQEQDCRLFDFWFQRYFESAKQRLFLKTSHWLQSKSWPKEKKYLKAPVIQYDTFAVNLKDLNQRQEKFLEANFQEKDQALFFEEHLNELLFPLPLGSRLALAKAMLGALDPYSTYFSDEEFSEFYEELSGKSAGVGITVEKSLKGLKITEVASKSPAELAGIKLGDQIIAVNGKNLSHLGFRDCTQLLKGEDQTEVSLTLETRSGQMSRTLKRTTQVFVDKKVNLVKVEEKMGKKIALITIPSFYGRGGLGTENEDERSASQDLRAEIERLQEQKPIGALILDLRGNPGGYLEEAVAMAGFFVGPKAIVGVKDREELRVLKADGISDPLYTGPLVIWVDEETASAGEVLAAALRDYQRAILVGTPATFGKGTVQKLIRLNDPFLNLNLDKEKGVLKLTTSLFFSPMGHSPANHGVLTDIVIANKTKKAEVGRRLKQQFKVKDVAPLVEKFEWDAIQEKRESFQAVLEKVKELDQEQSETEMAKVFGIANQVSTVNSF